jgi:signal transduction histidine kinase
LLTKLENYEYEAKAPVCISQIVREILASFDELIQMKDLTLRTDIEEKVYLPLHASLADLLVSNLISNAIRHNSPVMAGEPPNVRGESATSGAIGPGPGVIRVILTREGLVIANTGRPPQVPTAELFERFKKGNPGSDSIGIGLAIVRQISDLNGFDTLYEYSGGWHILAVSFHSRLPASKLLQNLSLPLQSRTESGANSALRP